MKKSSVLIVEDEKDIADLMRLQLEDEGLEVWCVDNSEEALKTLKEKVFHLLILDWMLPGVSGLELCKKIRNDLTHPCARVPILMVTARAHSSDIIVGLEMGADDYLTKPFDIPIFLARVRALIRRSGFLEKLPEKLSIGKLFIDTDAYKVTCHKKEVILTPSEFKLLVALTKNQGRVLTREKLIQLMQGDGVSVVDRTIDTHVYTLRKKLGPCSDLVESIRGIGYRIVSEE